MAGWLDAREALPQCAVMVNTPAGPESGTSAALRLKAPAKINLHLRVGPAAADGFHPILSWMCTVSLFDTLDMRLGRPLGERQGGGTGRDIGDGGVVSMTCDDPRLACDETNLVMKAGRLIADALEERGQQDRRATREGGASPTAIGAPTFAAKPGVEPAVEPIRGTASGESEETAAPVAVVPVAVTLGKRIPSGAGLAGGSSDGARAMLGLNRLWGGDLSRDELAHLSAKIGSDLPFFFYGASSVCSGRGEIVKSIRAPTVAKWAVLVLADIAMPTPAVYRKFDELGLGRTFESAVKADCAKWTDFSANKMLDSLVNDLEPAAFALQPDLGELRNQIETRLGRPVRMSGSGSSLFTLFDEMPEAEVAARQIGRELGVRTQAVEVSPALRDDLDE